MQVGRVQSASFIRFGRESAGNIPLDGLTPDMPGFAWLPKPDRAEISRRSTGIAWPRGNFIGRSLALVGAIVGGLFVSNGTAHNMPWFNPTYKVTTISGADADKLAALPADDWLPEELRPVGESAPDSWRVALVEGDRTTHRDDQLKIDIPPSEAATKPVTLFIPTHPDQHHIFGTANAFFALTKPDMERVSELAVTLWRNQQARLRATAGRNYSG